MAVLFRIFLIVIVLAGSVLMAPARGQMTGLSSIKVCAGADTRTLLVDARGVPVDPHQHCPDCVLCLATGQLPSTATAWFDRVAGPLIHPRPAALPAIGARTIPPSARDPPVLI